MKAARRRVHAPRVIQAPWALELEQASDDQTKFRRRDVLKSPTRAQKNESARPGRAARVDRRNPHAPRGVPYITGCASASFFFFNGTSVKGHQRNHCNAQLT